jgi:hypothetical protein
LIIEQLDLRWLSEMIYFENTQFKGMSKKRVFDPSSENEITPDVSITAATADWTLYEERRLVGRYGDPQPPSHIF